MPTITQVHDDVLPLLKRVLDSTDQKDIVSSCLIAMAKTGQDHADFKLADVFTPRLSSKTQQIRETAALALGIAGVGSERALGNLIALACDTDAGRRLTGGPVRPRTRAFALYGLGLYANEQSSLETKRRALTAMQTVFEDGSRNRNVTIAAIQAMGLLAFDRSNPKSTPLLDEALDTLLTAYVKKGQAGTLLVQSHCAGALVQLVGTDHPRSPSIRRLFAAELDRKNKSLRVRDLARSAVLGLGKMCAPNESKTSVDREYSELLMDTFLKHKDVQTRYFALIALGQIGGEHNRAFLLDVLKNGAKYQERPWAAIALGVQAHGRYEELEGKNTAVVVDGAVGAELLRQLKMAKSPELAGAIGIALGLTRYVEAAPAMAERIKAQRNRAEQSGYLCLGLALMQHQGSRGLIHDTMQAATRGSILAVQAAIALGMLGDETTADELCERLGIRNSKVRTLSAIAEALGLVGDRNSIPGLQRVLLDPEREPLHRAFAATSLGTVIDHAKLPWHARLSENLNYRSVVETQVNQLSGVLDIL